MIVKDYPNFNLKKNDIYYVNYKLLFKCNNEVWEKNLNKENNSFDNIIENNEYINDNEEIFIKENKDELILIIILYSILFKL